MKEFTEQDIERIEELIDDHNAAEATQEINSLHPADIAELFQSLNLKQAEWVFNLIDDEEKQADVLMELDEEDRRKLLEGMDSKEIGRFIDLLDTDDAVDLIQELDKEERDEVIQHIDDVEQAGNIVDLLKYDEDTAGGLMGTEMIVVNENLSMPDCIKEMRRQAEEMDDIYYIYVVDNDSRLQGILPLKKMLTHPSVSKIKHVMDTEPVSLHTDTPIDEVAIDFEKYDLVAMPVVDDIGRLVGQVTVDDVMDEVREASERDYQMAGISSDIDADDSIWAQIKARLPWLLIGIIGGIVNSIILGGFEEQIAKVAALAIFIPLIGGTGGNVGVQASAIVVQGLANGRLSLRNTGKQIARECLISLVNAIVISGVVAMYIFVVINHDKAAVMGAVASSLFVMVVFATVFGTFVPLMLERLHIDPARATGPFIQITNDIVGMCIYVGMSTWMLHVFNVRF
mgnify:CR=1 FL=1